MFGDRACANRLAIRSRVFLLSAKRSRPNAFRPDLLSTRQLHSDDRARIKNRCRKKSDAYVAKDAADPCRASNRLQTDNIDSQLNLASAALRFGQIDLARKTLERVAPRAQDLAAFHIVAGWLARAEGNLVEQEQQFAIAVNKDPQNDLYKFNLAALQIHSQDPKKSAQARDE